MSAYNPADSFLQQPQPQTHLHGLQSVYCTEQHSDRRQRRSEQAQPAWKGAQQGSWPIEVACIHTPVCKTVACAELMTVTGYQPDCIPLAVRGGLGHPKAQDHRINDLLARLLAGACSEHDIGWYGTPTTCTSCKTLGHNRTCMQCAPGEIAMLFRGGIARQRSSNPGTAICAAALVCVSEAVREGGPACLMFVDACIMCSHQHVDAFEMCA